MYDAQKRALHCNELDTFSRFGGQPLKQFRLNMNIRHVQVGRHRAHSCVAFDTPFPPIFNGKPFSADIAAQCTAIFSPPAVCALWKRCDPETGKGRVGRKKGKRGKGGRTCTSKQGPSGLDIRPSTNVKCPLIEDGSRELEGEQLSYENSGPPV